MILIIVASGLAGAILGSMLAHSYFYSACPMRLMGYSCKFETRDFCDHSEVAVLEARLNLAKNKNIHWGGGRPL